MNRTQQTTTSVILRHVTRTLGHASTIVACPETREAIVVDPGREIAPLLALVAEHDLTVKWVFDTHGHNDYLSGLVGLSEATGATRIGYVGLPTPWAQVQPEDGQRFELGTLELEAVHTPGHTPEHTCMLVHEGGEARTLVSGGSVLCGDVGRPDLLGGAGDIDVATAQLAESTLALLDRLDDSVTVLPTHVAGSLCAGAIGAGDDTTIGAERASNDAVLAMLRERAGGDAWLDRSLLPPVPLYWRRMRGANLEGLAPAELPSAPADLDAADATAALHADAVAVDIRTPDEFAAGHLRGAYYAPAGNSFVTWAGCLLEPGTPIVLIANRADDAAAAAADAWRIGLGPVTGFVTASAIDAWQNAGETIADIPQISAVDALTSGVTVVDVRAPLEVRDDPFPGALAHPATLLTREPDAAPSGPIAVLCAGGTRSMVAAAALARAGHAGVQNIRGGMSGMAS